MSFEKEGYERATDKDTLPSGLYWAIDVNMVKAPTPEELKAEAAKRAAQMILSSLTIDDVTDRCGHPDESRIGLESFLTYSNAFNTGPVVGTKFSTVDLFFGSSAHIDEREVDGVPYGSHHAVRIDEDELPQVMPCLLSGGVAN